MPPKKDKEKKAKQADDKTFGLKNKNKSAKVQRYVAEVKHQAVAQQKPSSGPSKKELEKQKKEELNEIFKPVQIQQKVPFGVDPKTIVCQYFKQGTCTKGKNCKFSHELNVERKGAKIDLYTDNRIDTDNHEDDTMDKWDQARLEEVVAKKHEPKGGVQTSTDIVCKFFIQAVEDSKYGWFWQCPNGEGCKYRHALPPGFQLKQSKKKDDEVVQTLEEWIEEQRRSLGKGGTPVTLESFEKWKRDRREKIDKERAAQEKARESAIKAGKQIGASGRELFTYNPDLFNTGDDDEAWDGGYMQQDENGGDNVDESVFAAENFDDLSIADDSDSSQE